MKAEIKCAVEKLSGSYERGLNLGTVTHLVVDSPTGNKYSGWKKYSSNTGASRRQICAVTTEWISQSQKTGIWVPESLFLLNNVMAEEKFMISQ